MNRRPTIRWAKAVGWSVGFGLLLVLPSRAAAQGVHPPMIVTPPPGTAPTAGERALGAEPSLPPTGAAIQPTPAPTTEVKPALPPAIQARPAREVPPPEPPPLAGTQPREKQKDALPDAGYVPGYSGGYPSFGLAPHSPSAGALPGGLTPGFGAPMPPSEWTFTWSGYLSASAQFSVNQRVTAAGEALAPGQSSTVFHTPPQTVDEYQSFVGTATVPGQWIAMNLRYGNRDVSANVTLSTWNPSESTTYYQPGSQNFIQNAYLAYNIAAIGRLKLNADAGYFYTTYGNLGQYGPGVYQNPVAGGPRGVGTRMLAQYALRPEWLLMFEAGVMGNRNGRAPSGTAPANPNSSADPTFPAAYVGHLHAGVVYKSDFVVKANLHWMFNWAMDDRVQYNAGPEDPKDPTGFTRSKDTFFTRAINEALVPDGWISVLAADVQVSHPIWGILGIGGTHIDAQHAYPLRGLLTYGGEGQQLTERWLGVDNGGTGKVEVAIVNWSASIGKILASPLPFDTNAPDLIVNAGAVIATSHDLGPSMSDRCNGQIECRNASRTYDGRWRYKAAVDLLYVFLPWMSIGGRFDRVMPNSKDSEETFHVLAGRLVFKSDWASRETISLIGARWFYGPQTHAEYSSPSRPWLDQWLVALNVNMWW
jgi:hypothetical protein